MVVSKLHFLEVPFCYHFTFMWFLRLVMTCVSHGQQKDGFCFLILLVILNGELKTLILRVIIEM